jgi:transposase-like protein
MTYVQVTGQSRDQHAQLVDVLLSVKRDLTAARAFFVRALREGTVSVEITTARAVTTRASWTSGLPGALHTVEQHANHPVEADHGRLKARLRPMRGLKRHRSARTRQLSSVRAEPARRTLRHRHRTR